MAPLREPLVPAISRRRRGGQPLGQRPVKQTNTPFQPACATCVSYFLEVARRFHRVERLSFSSAVGHGGIPPPLAAETACGRGPVSRQTRSKTVSCSVHRGVPHCLVLTYTFCSRRVSTSACFYACVCALDQARPLASPRVHRPRPPAGFTGSHHRRRLQLS